MMNETLVLLKEKEAAIYIGMSPSYLQHDRCDGAIAGKTPRPAFIRIGRSIRYLKTDLDYWLSRSQVKR